MRVSSLATTPGKAFPQRRRIEDDRNSDSVGQLDDSQIRAHRDFELEQNRTGPGNKRLKRFNGASAEISIGTGGNDDRVFRFAINGDERGTR